MSWSLNFEVLHEMVYFVQMFCGHSILSPSLTLPTNDILITLHYNVVLRYSRKRFSVWRPSRHLGMTFDHVTNLEVKIRICTTHLIPIG